MHSENNTITTSRQSTTGQTSMNTNRVEMELHSVPHILAGYDELGTQGCCFPLSQYYGHFVTAVVTALKSDIIVFFTLSFCHSELVALLSLNESVVLSQSVGAHLSGVHLPTIISIQYQSNINEKDLRYSGYVQG